MKHLGLFLSLALLTASAACPIAHADDISCPSAFAKLADETLPEDRMFLRNPGKITNDLYRTNLQKVAFDFEGAMNSGQPLGSFEEFLANQHRAAILGKEPGTFYWPEKRFRRDGLPIPIAFFEVESKAGKYRNVLTEVGPESPLVLDTPELGPGVLDEIKARTAGRPGADIKSGPVPMFYQRPKLDGIPKEASPYYTSATYTKGMTFSYPPSKYLPLYMKQMGESLEKVRAGLNAEKVNKNQVLKNLAHYYQMFMIGHPFIRVNNSVGMVQVNVVLKKLGMNTVYHGDLDFIVRSLDTKQAEEAFINYVKIHQ